MGVRRNGEEVTHTVTLKLERNFHFDDREPLHEDDMVERAIDMFLDLIHIDSDTIIREEIGFVRIEEN